MRTVSERLPRPRLETKGVATAAPVDLGLAAPVGHELQPVQERALAPAELHQHLKARKGNILSC